MINVSDLLYEETVDINNAISNMEKVEEFFNRSKSQIKEICIDEEILNIPKRIGKEKIGTRRIE